MRRWQSVSLPSQVRARECGRKGATLTSICFSASRSICVYTFFCAVVGVVRAAATKDAEAAAATKPKLPASVPVVKNKLKDILAGLKKTEVTTIAKSRGAW